VVCVYVCACVCLACLDGPLNGCCCLHCCCCCWQVESWTYDFTLMTFASVVIFGAVGVQPLALYFTLRYLGLAPPRLSSLLTLYGYGITVYIPASVRVTTQRLHPIPLPPPFGPPKMRVKRACFLLCKHCGLYAVPCPLAAPLRPGPTVPHSWHASSPPPP
jgi:hypothetical protein